MPIIFDETRKLFHLSTLKTSYVFMILENEILMHLYYGKKLDNLEGIEKNTFISDRAFSAVNKENGISSDCIPQEYSFYGNSDLRKPAFHAQYADGSRITRMKYVSHKIIDGKPKLKGLPSTYVETDDEAKTLEIKMKDSLTGLVLIYRYSVYSEIDAITRSVTAVNEGNTDINIKAIMSMSIDFDNSDYDLIHLSGAWARERFVKRVPLNENRIQIESRRGSSSHHHSPFIALAEKMPMKSKEVYTASVLFTAVILRQERRSIPMILQEYTWVLIPLILTGF